MGKGSNHSADVICHCDKLPVFLHELNQSLLIIHAYVSGCSERIKVNGLNNEQLSAVFKSINEHTELINNKIHDVLNIRETLALPGDSSRKKTHSG